MAMAMRLGAGTIRFDRNELSGAFGDIGTDFPLLTGMILACGLDPAGALAMFGVMQILSGLAYGLPVPAQPLKAVAVIAIGQRLAPEVIFGGGLAIGALMLLLTLTGLVDLLARLIPKAVVRGIQVGLGLQLGLLALRDYIPSEGAAGFALAAAAFAVGWALSWHPRYPRALIIIGLGVGYAVLVRGAGAGLLEGVGLHLPRPAWPGTDAVATGLLTLALPQIPLSLGNSVLATRQVVDDLFGRRLPVRKIGLTYALMNLTGPLFGGVPTCHGSGGVAGHHAFGARTGGAVLIYGLFYIVLGVFFADAFAAVVELFPLPILGVILLFEALALLSLVRDVAGEPGSFGVALLVGLMAVGLPYGYLWGLVVGTLLASRPGAQKLTRPN